MIEIHPVRDKDRLKILYESASIPMNDNSVAVVAADGDKILGNCLFDLDTDRTVIHSIEPSGDALFADGLLRSALHVGVENGRLTAYYSENAPEKLFKTLGFIKNAEKRQLNVDKLFSSCKNCESE